MQPHVIQFGNLEDLVAELPAAHVVRVVALDVTEGAYQQVAELRLAGIGVHVRAVNSQGHILACYLPVARMQVFGRRPRPDDPGAEKYSQAWDEAEALKARVCAYLDERGFAVRGGVIHLGEAQLMHGHWPSDPAGRPSG
jgi:hypothetical protein